jgi:hypothetical protein
MKNTRIMMTQPMGGSQGDIYAISATVKELNAIYQVGHCALHWGGEAGREGGGDQECDGNSSGFPRFGLSFAPGLWGCRRL